MIKPGYFSSLLVIALLLAGCATSGPPFVMPEPPGDLVTLYAFRPSSIVGGGNSDIVAINGRFIGRVNSGTYAVYHTEPGHIVVSRKAGSIFFGSGEDGGWGLGSVVGFFDGFHTVVELDGKPGDVYFVQFSAGELVDNKQALPLMDGLENITPQQK